MTEEENKEPMQQPEPNKGLPTLYMAVTRDDISIVLEASGHDLNEAGLGISFLLDKYSEFKKSK